MSDFCYFMENEDEILRLEMKTDLDKVKCQALRGGKAQMGGPQEIEFTTFKSRGVN